MNHHLLLLAPSANRVYAGEAPRLAAAELAVTANLAATPTSVAHVDYLSFTADDPDLAAIARSSAAWALFRVTDTPDTGAPQLTPVPLPLVAQCDDALVTIPKYQGKTNEQFTRLLLNVTLSQVRAEGPVTVLDPLCGRGTTLTTAWLLGHDAAGVEADVKQVEAMAAFLKTYLRRKRVKHHAEVNPVRREGKALGRKLEAEAELPDGRRRLTVFTGDTRQSAALFGKRRFAAIVTDAPYGVVHGAQTDVKNPRSRDRSAAALLREAIPVWASQLAPGGALGLSWNALGLPRADLLHLLAAAGLTPRDEGPWQDFAHRVDSSIHRDIAVAVKD